MQKRIDFAFNILGGAVTLLVLFFVITSVISQFQKKATVSNGTQTNVPASGTKSDDRLIVFTSEQDGNPEIYTMHADGSGLTNITNNPAHDLNPYWSPDGNRIAFESDRNGFMQIFLMNADGSNIAQLTSDEADHLLPLNSDAQSNPWSPHGDTLVFLQHGQAKETWTLHSIKVNGEDNTSLVTGRFSFNDISWSANGKLIGFVLDDPRNTDSNSFVPNVHVIHADGSNLLNVQELLPASDALGSPYNFRWSRDGQSLSLIASNVPISQGGYSFGSEGTPTFYWKVYHVDLESKATTLLTATRTPIGGWWQGSYFIQNFGEPTFTWVSSAGEITTFNPTKDCERIYNENTGGYADGTSSYTQSSNGNMVIGAYCPNGDMTLFLVNSQGTEFIPLLNLPDIAPSNADGSFSWIPANFAWSQDDHFIAFNIFLNNKTEMYVLDVAESIQNPSLQPVQISIGNGELYYPPSWQPIAEEDIAELAPTPEPENTPASTASEGLIVFAAEQEIYTMHVDGSDLTNITNDPAYDGNPTWSPNGQRLAFGSDRNGNFDIFTMNPDGSNVVQLTDNPGYDGNFAWSPNGHKIVYQSSSGDDPNVSQLMVMDAGAGNKILLTESTGSYIFLGWSPNGQKIVYLKQNLETNDPHDTEIHVMDIDGTNHYQWLAIIDEIKWMDDEHFVGHGWSGISEPPSWRLYKFDANGSDPTELTTTPGRIVALFRQTYLVEDLRTFAWYSIEGNTTPLKSQDFNIHCEKPGDRFMQDTNHVLSPDETRAFVTVHCSEGTTWFYFEDSTGAEFKQLSDFILSDPYQFIEANWSRDGKYVIASIASRNGGTTDLYLFDVQKMLNDRTAQPIQVTKTGVWKYGATFQPNQPLSFSLSMTEAESLTGFDILEPSFVPEGFKLAGVAYYPPTQEVVMRYTLREKGILDIYQQPGELPELHQDPAVSQYIQHVPIGDADGEYLEGSWEFDTSDTTTPRWNPNGAISLSWQNDGFAFHIIYIGVETTPPISADALISIAESMK